MRRGGRAVSCAGAGLICTLFYACISFAASVDYGVPIEIKRWDNGRTPLAHMVDVTNGFGLKVLAEHNFLNENNIAFSPYGLMGILVALYEGVDGDSSYQLQRAIQLPWNRKVMRVGFRDIHRTLKTYFVPEEGFLAGLALNNENVTFNDNFKKVLRFYGFDLENDQLPTFPEQSNKTTNETVPMTSTLTPKLPAEGSTTGPTATTENTREETTPTSSKEASTNPNAETIDPMATTTAIPSLAPNAESTTTTVSTKSIQEVIKPLISTTETTTHTVTTTANAATIANPTDSTTTEIASTMMSNPSSIDIDEETIGQQMSQATVALTQAENEVENTGMFSSSTSSLTETTSASTIETQTESVTFASSTVETTSTDISTTLDMTTPNNNSSLETLQRRKKSIVDFIFTNPPYIDDYMYRSFDIPAEPPKSTFDEKMFLANGLKSVQVTYMHYDTILEYAYLPHLEASAIRLPLDSERYYLLVVLPVRGNAAELGRLLARMARESDLSDIYAALRPRRVRGIVPSFTVKGHVTLTTDLQKLGIRDVFEPRQRDFTPMTPQSGVYVRSIEQAVSVAIRKYHPDDQKKNRYVSNHDPVHFFATYPFLYFVMDASIHVSLMAGKMVDPLNSRIL